MRRFRLGRSRNGVVLEIDQPAWARFTFVVVVGVVVMVRRL